MDPTLLGLGLLSPRDDSWGYPALPEWVEEFRPQQIDAVEMAIDAYRSGVRVLFGEMPTGAGKSLVAEMVRRMLQTRAVYLVSTKQLQRQIEDAFLYASVLWGRANYPTYDRSDHFPKIHAGMCDKEPGHFCDLCDVAEDVDERTGCSFCHPVSHCFYERAKRQALAADLAVLNYRYALTEMNYVGRFGEQRDRGGRVTSRIPLMVGDECDVLEDELMGFVEVNISPRRRRQFQIDRPGRKTVESAFVQWALSTEQHLLNWDTRGMPIEDQRWVLRTISNLARLKEGLKDGRWVYDDAAGDSIIFRPVKVDREAGRYLWKHADRWLLMSATICSAEVMARDLGLEDHEWASFSIGSSFDPKRRPIYVTPQADMRQKAGQQEWTKMAEAVSQILDNYPTERVFIPTVSYRLTDYLMLNVRQKERLVTYTTAATRMDALERYRKQEGAVLLAPAMDRGLDLRDDDARCVIICKVPFPYLGDKQVSARMHSSGGRDWYTVQAIRRIVQATGRAMRHEKDYCDTWVLDKSFTDLYARYGRWFPRWWREAIDWTRGGGTALRSRGRAREVALGG